jgi:hypothetical protein
MFGALRKLQPLPGLHYTLTVTWTSLVRTFFPNSTPDHCPLTAKTVPCQANVSGGYRLVVPHNICVIAPAAMIVRPMPASLMFHWWSETPWHGRSLFSPQATSRPMGRSCSSRHELLGDRELNIAHRGD